MNNYSFIFNKIQNYLEHNAAIHYNAENQANFVLNAAEDALCDYQWSSDEEKNIFFHTLPWKVRLLYLTLNRLHSELNWITAEEIIYFMVNSTQPAIILQLNAIASIFYCYSHSHDPCHQARSLLDENKSLLQLHEPESISFNSRKLYIESMLANLSSSFNGRKFEILTMIIEALLQKNIQPDTAQLDELIYRITKYESTLGENSFFVTCLNMISINQQLSNKNIILRTINNLLENFNKISLITEALLSADIPLHDEQTSYHYISSLLSILNNTEEDAEYLYNFANAFFSVQIPLFRSFISQKEYAWLIAHLAQIDTISNIFDTTNYPEENDLPLMNAREEIIALTGEDISIIAFLMETEKRFQSTSTPDTTLPWLVMLESAIVELATKEILSFSRFHALLENICHAEHVRKVLRLIPHNEDQWNKDELIDAFENLIEIATEAETVYKYLLRENPHIPDATPYNDTVENLCPDLTPETLKKTMLFVACATKPQRTHADVIGFFHRPQRKNLFSINVNSVETADTSEYVPEENSAQRP